MKTTVYCACCRKPIDSETCNFWQGTAWCNRCKSVVPGSLTSVPMWVMGTVLLLVIRLQIIS